MIRIGFKFALAPIAAVLLSVSAAQAQTATDLKCTGCVGTTDLGNNSVTSSKIRNGHVKPSDLSDGAKPSGAAYSQTKKNFNLGPTPQTMRKVTMELPSDGIVIANASGNPYFSASGAETIYCTITKYENSLVDSATEIVTAQTGDNDLNKDTPIALTRAFKFKKGKISIYFRCKQTGGNSNVYLYQPVLVALFVPGNYSASASDAGDAEEDLTAED